MTVPKEISELVERFDRNREAYRSAQYNETQLRREFIDPFFKALGWDIDNEKGYAEAYKDVIHEDAIKVGGATKAPDYCFRVGGARKFFLEAKKPAVNLMEDINPAYQLRRYAWSAKLPLSILTDFEEFAVYDCRFPPQPNEKPSTARILYLTYPDYVSRWEEITSVFSREAVLQGSFDKYAESSKSKRGTAEVDKAFLKEIESWREALARNLALRNPELTQRELNFAVQRTIDRIIFLRMCEDRGIEPYGQLQALLNGENTYARLRYLYGIADDRYNSGLFHFKLEKGRAEAPDGLTLTLTVDDKVLKDIIRRLYYPESPYEFSVLGADILGNVYEQFLGKVIRLTPGHRAVVEEKPEVKKAGGIYYTPAYIVDYIVKNTVGKLCEGKSPKQIAKLKILDPACGSGSFLIGAYGCLLNYHRDWYVKDDPQKHTKEIYQGAGGQWLLSTQEKKRILLSNIYGVDIDSQAVEVTKLSLLLKVLEGENEVTLNRQLKMLRERALPDLGNNIKCGNSLIGPDFYDNQQMSLLDDEERHRINIFDWNSEFPEIMKAGGFDAVIGNPPYVRMEVFKQIKQYLRDHYESHDERTDLYVYFIEKSLRLLRRGGLYGVIVSNKWVRSKYGERLRGVVIGNATIERMIDFGELPVFQGAATFPVIFIARRGSPQEDYSFSFTHPLDKELFQRVISGAVALADAEKTKASLIPSKNLSPRAWRFGAAHIEDLLVKLTAIGEPLAKYTNGRIRYGIKTGLVEAFVIDKETRHRLVEQSPDAVPLIKPYVIGDDVRNYHIRREDRFLIYTYHGVDMQGCTSVLCYLEQFKSRLQDRATKQKWYELQQPQQRYIPDYESPKIIYPDIAKESRFALDTSGLYPADTTFIIPLPDRYLLGVLNSRVVFFYLGMVCPVLGDARQGGRLRLKLNYIQELPIPRIDLSRPDDNARYNKVVTLVEHMLELHKELAAAKTPDDKTRLQRRIDATNRQIDQLVYELYGLTEEEIKVVEEATRK